MKTKFYAIHRNDKGDKTNSPIPGVYNSWTKCEKEVSGRSNCKFKKFNNLTDAQHFVKTGKVKEKVVNKKVKSTKEKSNKRVLDKDLYHEAVTVNLSTFDFKGLEFIEVWTDGSGLGNGKKGCRAGYGVFFSLNDPRNVSKPVKKNPNNQRAEMLAIKKAISILLKQYKEKKDKPIIRIYTDSEYSINCVSHWYKNWERNNWKTKKGTEVKHSKVIKKIIEMRKEIPVEFIHVRSHKSAPTDRYSQKYKIWYGNFMADKLAVDGAKKS